MSKPLPQSFYERDALVVAEELLGQHIHHAGVVLRCATAIASPMGLRDKLFHVWKKNGKLRARVPLNIVGGRKQGFRTHSRITPGGRGKFTCRVETANGQVLGSRSVKISAS